MHIISNIWLAIFVVTLLALAIATIALVVQGFRRHYVWGLAILFVPFSVAAFALLHWDRARRPFLLWAGATAALTIEILLTVMLKSIFGQ